MKPMREAILDGTEKVITSEEFKCSFPLSSYSLVVSTGLRNDPYVSAKLFLLPGMCLNCQLTNQVAGFVPMQMTNRLVAGLGEKSIPVATRWLV